MARTIALALFRNDLRLHDNAVLHHLHTKNPKPSHVLPIYVFDERQVELSGLPGFERKGGEAKTGLCKFWRTGPFRLRFIIDAVFDLQKQLRERGSNLLIRWGVVEQVTASIVKALQDEGHKVEGVYLQKEMTTEELQTERRLEKLLMKLNVPVVYFHTKPLVHPDDLPFPTSKMPDVFTPFRKRVEGLHPMARPVLQTPHQLLPFPDHLPEPSDVYGAQHDQKKPQELLGLLVEPMGLKGSEGAQTDKRTAFPYGGGESEALRRLDDYFLKGRPPNVARYKSTRNQLLGEGYSTKMSPFLAFGCISPRLILETLTNHEEKFGATKDTYWVLFEILWRDFFLYTAEKFGHRLFTLAGFEEVTDPKSAAKRVTGWKPWIQPESGKPAEVVEAWMEGRTGVPFLDANMMELRQSGFMSNRGRQNVASFLTKDLYYDWRIGAEFFEAHLLDYDPASNYGNWEYVAGVGNDPRASRQFNPIKQAKDYDGVGEYVKTWLPQLGRIPSNRVHTPWLLTDAEWEQYGIKDYPRKPILEQGSWKSHYDRKDARGGRPPLGARKNGPPQSKKAKQK